MNRNFYTKNLILAFVLLFSVDAFAPTVNSSTRNGSLLTPISMAVIDIDSEGTFDNTIKTAAGSLVVVDYSTTW